MCQGCPEAKADVVWKAGSGINLPDHADYGFDDCRSEIDGAVVHQGSDGWILKVVDDDGQQPGDDQDRSSYCKLGVFDDACQSAVYEVMARTFSGDSDPPHDITDIVFHCGLRDTDKDISIVITTEGVGFATGSPLDWLQVDLGQGDVDAFYNMNGTDDRQHIYRVVKDGTDTIKLIVDKEERLSFTYDELGDHTLNQSDLATTGSQGESEFYLRYYRYRIGATEFQTTSVGCDADFDADDDVDTTDLVALLAHWGSCPPSPANCPWDIDEDGEVSTVDLLSLLASFTLDCTQ